MAQPRLPKTDWLLEAWNLCPVIADIPARRRTLSALGVVPLDEYVETYLQQLQSRLRDWLNYRVAKKLGSKKAKTLPRFDSDDSLAVIDLRNVLVKAGMIFSDADHNAIFVHIQLGFILQRRYLDDAERIRLPVTLASVSGQSAAAAYSIRASRQRKVDRRGPVARIVADERSRDPFATCAQVLDRICNSDKLGVREVIQGYKDERLFFYDDKRKLKNIGLDRFQTIYSEQRPSTG